jgi:hypothetical protein
MPGLSDRAQQIFVFLNAIIEYPPEWTQVSKADVERLNSRLIELDAEIPGIAEACLPDTDLRSNNRSREPFVIKDRYMRAVHQARSLIMRRGGSGRNPSSVPDVVDQRYQVLADLIQAYLKDPGEEIVEGQPSSDGTILYHPGFVDGKMHADPVMAHLRALANEGLITWSPTVGSRIGIIGIPTRVLEATELKSATTGREVQQVVNNYFNSNIAQGGVGHSQTVNVGFQAGDVPGFLAALRSLGLGTEEIQEFEVAVGAMDGLERAEALAKRFSEGAVTNATGTALYAAIGNYRTVVELVHRLFGLV